MNVIKNQLSALGTRPYALSPSQMTKSVVVVVVVLMNNERFGSFQSKEFAPFKRG